ncbi:MAG: GspH/FimT family pseudopilin [Nitrospiraceae bacterium]
MNQNGYSLLELIMVMTATAVSVALAVPDVAAMVARYREQAVVTEMAGELRTARLMAMTQASRVRAVISGDGGSMSLEREGEPLVPIRRFDLRDRGVSIDEATQGVVVWFHPSGRTASAITLTIRGSSGRVWRLTVSMTGRITVQ